MRKNFDPRQYLKGVSFSSPQVLVRAVLGALLLANVIAAGFAFHWWNDSPRTLDLKIEDAQHKIAIERGLLNRSKNTAAKVVQARTQGGEFVNTYMTPRKSTYSTILGELNQMATTAGIKTKETSIASDAVENSESLSILTITAGYEAPYSNLLKFVNLLDKSKRFLIIESLTAAPQPSTGILLVTIKLNTFVRDDAEDQS